ncbi:MAG TPA: hydroxyphenylacetyl-CoA thioesterase PaaI [Burkholderiales bacterium]
MEDPHPSQDAAEAAVKAMWRDDRCAAALGMRVLEVSPGAGRVEMRVREDMLNGHGTTHGGMIFTLADAAFAIASNSRGRRALAAGCSIEFLRPAVAGDLLVASASEQSLGARSGIYDVRVENQHGETVALFRGKAALLRGSWTDDTPPV